MVGTLPYSCAMTPGVERGMRSLDRKDGLLTSGLLLITILWVLCVYGLRSTPTGNRLPLVSTSFPPTSRLPLSIISSHEIGNWAAFKPTHRTSAIQLLKTLFRWNMSHCSNSAGIRSLKCSSPNSRHVGEYFVPVGNLWVPLPSPQVSPISIRITNLHIPTPIA